jgi:hypothetical protein
MAAKTFAPRPDQVRIGNHLYVVHWIDGMEWQGRDFDMSKDGLTYSMNQQIFIRLVPDRRESLYQEIFLHELLHALWDSHGVSLDPNWNQGEPDDVEENLALYTAPALVAVLKGNPHVAKYLIADGDVIR